MTASWRYCHICGQSHPNATGCPPDMTDVDVPVSVAVPPAPPEAVEQALDEVEQSRLDVYRVGMMQIQLGPTEARRQYEKAIAQHAAARSRLLALYRARADGETVEGKVEWGDFLTGEMRERLERAKRVRAVVVPDDWPVSATVTVTRRRAAAEQEGNG